MDEITFAACYPTTDSHDIDELRAQLSAANAEIERLTVAMNKYSEDEVLCQTKLAASQLREKVLREALDEVLPCCDLHCIGGMEAYRKGIEAISQPTDDSALREFVADEMVNMIDNCYPHECRDYAERYRKCEV